MTRRVSALRCRVCGEHCPITRPLSWRCPNATPADRHHVLALVTDGEPVDVVDDANPFVAYRPALAWDAFAGSLGMTDAARVALVRHVDDLVAGVVGTGFRHTPLERADSLSDALGFDASGGIWVKDETGNVAGSHKARHLVTILLHVLAAEHAAAVPWRGAADRPPLAIASCGNAALAAATLAAAVLWPIRVFVPPSANPSVVDQLSALGASIVVCPRVDGDPPGDPCVHRFREAVAAGAVPFSVQGPENAWCLDGGRTIGWELLTQHAAAAATGGRALDRVIVQVGGGAFAACIGAAITGDGTDRCSPRLDTVQTEGCAPLARAWRLAADQEGRTSAASRWGSLMWPWEHEPRSAADGILDDETYDWLAVFEGMSATGGAPIVAAEAHVIEAHRLALTHTGINVSPTGSAGLAGLLAVRDSIDPGEQVAVVFSGVGR